MFKYYLAVLKKYATFSGRARRKEYWYFTLMNLIIACCFSSPFFYYYWEAIFNMVHNKIPSDYISEILSNTILNMPAYALGLYIAGVLYSIAVFIPNLAVHIRRLHDVGKSGWFLLIPYLGILPQLIPQIGSLVYLFLTLICSLVSLGLMIWFLVLMCTDSQVGENKYGADPKAEERNITL